MQRYVPLWIDGELVLVPVQQTSVDAADALLRKLHTLFVETGAYAELCAEKESHIIRGYD